LPKLNHIKREQRTITHMISIYCHGQGHAVSGMCADCGSILRYAEERISSCPYRGSPKPACGLCRTNCFTPEMQRRFAQIMRYAGPKMLVRHPLLTLVHVWDAVRAQKKLQPNVRL